MLTQNKLKKRTNRFKEDPEQVFLFAKLDREMKEKYLSTPEGKLLIKSAIDHFCAHLRIKKYKFSHEPTNKIVMFFYRGSWVTLKYCGSCYVDIMPTIERPNKLSFIVRDGRDILEKLQKYNVVFRDF